MSPTDCLALLAVALFVVGVVLGVTAAVAWLAETATCECRWDDEGVIVAGDSEQPPA